MVRIRGLPFGATTRDVKEFFSGLSLASHEPVLAIPLDSRPPGEAYVRFRRSDDAERAMRRHKALMGRRFIEVFKVVDPAEIEEAKTRWLTLEEAADRLNIDTAWEATWKEEDGYVVRLRGLPWESTLADIKEFFSSIPLADQDIDLVSTEAGKQTGEAFVRLRDREQMVRALERNKKLIGRRYIEVYKSTAREFEQPTERKELERRPIAPVQGGPPPSYRGGEGRGGEPRSSGYAGAGSRGPPAGMKPPPPASVMPSRLPRAEQAGRDGYMSFYGRTGRVEGGRKGPVGAGYVVRIRGLSFGTTEREVYDFFSPIPLAALHIIVDYAGRPSGDAYAEVETEEDEARALDRHRQPMGRRYIEVFRCSPSELAGRIAGGAAPPMRRDEGYRGGPPPPRGGPPPPRGPMGGGYGGPPPFPHAQAGGFPPPMAGGSPDDPAQSTCLKARGIPWEATEEDVLKFFQQSGFSPISLHRQQGEAFVEFALPDHASAAMRLHRGLIGNRYIELARCSYNEMARVVGLPPKEAPPAGYGGPPPAGYPPGAYAGGYGMGGGGYGGGGYGGGYEMMGQGGYGAEAFAGQGYPPQGGGFGPPGY